MNKIVEESKKVIELQPKINEVFNEINSYASGYKTLENENKNIKREVQVLEYKNYQLEKENKGEILNIALNDVSMFQEQNALASIVNEWNEKLPISLGDFGYIDEMKFEKKFVTFTLCTNDSLIDIDEMTKEIFYLSFYNL